MKNLGIIILLIISLSIVSTTASAIPLAVIKINDAETVTFLNHTSEPNGNWIVLNGGTPVQIPKIIFEYNGRNISFNKNGKIINVTSPTSYKVQYPFLNHPMYANNSQVNATFNSSSDITGNIDVYLIKTYPTELRDIAGKMADGNTIPFRNLLNKSIKSSISVGSPINFGQLSAGDYVVIVMLNESNENNLTIASATTFQVLEYNLTATVPDNVRVGNFLKPQVKLDAPDANYTYGAFLVRKDVFENFHLKLWNNGTKAGINLTLEDEYLIDGFKILGKGLNNLNKNALKNLTEGFLKSNKGSVQLNYGRNNTSISFITDDLTPGNYILSIGVWSNKKDQRLVGFIQKEVVVSQKSGGESPGGSSGGGSSGGGGGIFSNEPPGNIKRYEIIYRDLLSNQKIKYLFTPDGSSIIEVIITGKENENDIPLRIEYLNGPSSIVSELPPGVISYYFNAYPGTKKIKEATIYFRVENSWITDNDLASGEIHLLKWDGSKWLQLDTIEKSKDESYTYFETITETFSNFAVSGIKNMPAGMPGETIESTPQTTSGPNSPVNKPATLDWVIYGIVAMLIIAAGYLYIIKKKG